MPLGIFLIIEGGWVLCLCTYNGTFRKFTTCFFTSMVTRRPCSLNMEPMLFLIFSAFFGVASVTARHGHGILFYLRASVGVGIVGNPIVTSKRLVLFFAIPVAY